MDPIAFAILLHIAFLAVVFGAALLAVPRSGVAVIGILGCALLSTASGALLIAQPTFLACADPCVPTS